MRPLVCVALVAMAALLASPAHAGATQAGTAPSSAGAGIPAVLVPGKPVRITTAAPFNLHAIEGASGLWVHASLALPGPAALTLYDPDGAEVLSVDGEGTIKLDAVLSLDQVYYLGVARARADQPYTLSLATEEPDLHMAVFSMRVGYSSTTQAEVDGAESEVRSCWLEPGIKLRRIYPEGTEDVTLGRGGKEYSSLKARDGRSATAERELRFDGDRVTISADGQDQDVELESLFLMHGERFHRYLCKADDT